MAEPNTGTPPPPEAQQDIAQAVAETAAAGGSQTQVADAAQTAAAEHGIKLTDEQAKQIAAALSGPVVEGLLDGMEKRGVFREEPEPVQPPPTTAPEAPADARQATPVGDPHTPAAGEAPPVKQSWAARHFG